MSKNQLTAQETENNIQKSTAKVHYSTLTEYIRVQNWISKNQ